MKKTEASAFLLLMSRTWRGRGGNANARLRPDSGESAVRAERRIKWRKNRSLWKECWGTSPVSISVNTSTQRSGSLSSRPRIQTWSRARLTFFQHKVAGRVNIHNVRMSDKTSGVFCLLACVLQRYSTQETGQKKLTSYVRVSFLRNPPIKQSYKNQASEKLI